MRFSFHIVTMDPANESTVELSPEELKKQRRKALKYLSNKAYYERHKDGYLKESVRCECGLIVKRFCMSRHRHTKTHLTIMEHKIASI